MCICGVGGGMGGGREGCVCVCVGGVMDVAVAVKG